MTQGNPSAPARRSAPESRTNLLRIGGVVVLAIVLAVIVWLVVRDNGDDNKSTPGAAPAAAASVNQLLDTQRSVGHQIYWAGRRANSTYELTQVNGNVYIRYLPSGTGVGDPRPNFLTVGTYPRRNAYASLKRLARRDGNTSNKLAGGGLSVSSGARPQSVYLAYPGADLQVEVYDPSPSTARRLAQSGRVKPIR
jgi:hypothetical protein